MFCTCKPLEATTFEQNVCVCTMFVPNLKKDKIKKSVLDGNWLLLNEYQQFTPSELFSTSKPAHVYSLILTTIANILLQIPLLYILFFGGPILWVVAGTVIITSGAALRIIEKGSRRKEINLSQQSEFT